MPHKLINYYHKKKINTTHCVCISCLFRMIVHNNLYKYYISCRKQNVLNAMYYIAPNVTM